MAVLGAEQFKLAVRDFLTKVPREQLVAATKKIGLEAFRGIVAMTPVQTGRARGSWQVTVDRSADPEFGYVDPSPSDEPGDPPGADHEARAVGAMTNLQPFSVVHVGSNLVYIQPLEDGSSNQAPNGMVAATFARLESKYGSAKL